MNAAQRLLRRPGQTAARLLFVALAAAGCGSSTTDAAPDVVTSDVQGSYDMVVSRDGGSGDAGAVALDGAELDTTSAADTGSEARDVPREPPAPGSLAACALLYRGFDTCCAWDEDTAEWVFEENRCAGADQCMEDVDCPAGWAEWRSNSGECRCVSGRPGPIPLPGCPDDPRPQVEVEAGETCPAGQRRCPYAMPANGAGGARAYCSACPCDFTHRLWDMSGTLYCPEDEDRAGCPCEYRGDECCLRVGEGLYCDPQTSEWEFFWDCPCFPEESGFGCEGPMPELCRGVD